MPRIACDRFALDAFAELDELTAYLANRPSSTSIELIGAGRRTAVQLTQTIPQRRDHKVIARTGDILGFRAGLLVVDRASRRIGANPVPLAPGETVIARAALPAPVRPGSANQERNARQRALFELGHHPLTKAPLAEDAAPLDDPQAPGRRCGSCWFRQQQGPRRGKFFQKCTHPGELGKDEVAERGYPHATRGAVSDVNTNWPACVHHSYGDPGVSQDAARYVPEAAAR